ncbi:DNA-directed RNA polymerase II subunit RPB1-like [Homarus americanus]|uniref:DNA-directed RNA polymerase II subunit RPB1-like n=1 Tax=Homarus americanus TaxID=6706 RepID=UPI001C493516|nr:DNA-directed RNA polymerase II subunit RPB1-like [Homarus americanus]
MHTLVMVMVAVVAASLDDPPQSRSGYFIPQPITHFEVHNQPAPKSVPSSIPISTPKSAQSPVPDFGLHTNLNHGLNFTPRIVPDFALLPGPEPEPTPALNTAPRLTVRHASSPTQRLAPSPAPRLALRPVSLPRFATPPSQLLRRPNLSPRLRLRPTFTSRRRTYSRQKPTKPIYSDPKPIYSHPKPTYSHPKPIYSHSKPNYSDPKPTYSKPTYSHPKPTHFDPEPTSTRPNEVVPILVDDRVQPSAGSYSFRSETSDGVRRQESGKAVGGVEGPVNTVSGSYSYILPDGQVFELTYVADENGFQPQSSSLPLAPAFPHPIPAHALHQIQRGRRLHEARARRDQQLRQASSHTYTTPTASPPWSP